MRIKAKDFGPIRNADVVVKPMTILLGKNNLGKSYFAQLFYIILNAFQGYPYGMLRALFGVRFENFRIISEEMISTEQETKRLIKRIKIEKLEDVKIVDIITKSILNRNYKKMQKLLKLELERGFGVKISNLVNVNSSAARVKCDIFENLTFEFELTKRGQVNIKLGIKKGRIEKLAKKHASLIQKIRTKRKKKPYAENLVGGLQLELLSLGEEIPLMRIDQTGLKPAAYYIPAGRGGLIESYDMVIEGLFYRAPLAPVAGLTMPPLPGMAAQFYNCMRRIEGKRGPLSKVVTKSFRDLLGGDIKLVGVRIRKAEKPLRTKFVYQFRAGKKYFLIDLIHAASMIKEIAPIYLITRELVHRGDFLLIEEPESHLHPGAQFKMAGILATLVRNGANILLTTHSLVMLRKLSHFVGKKPEEEAPLIDLDSIAVYWLREGKYGSTTKMLKISPHGALDEIPSFDEVVNELYEEELELQSGRED